MALRSTGPSSYLIVTSASSTHMLAIAIRSFLCSIFFLAKIQFFHDVVCTIIHWQFVQHEVTIQAAYVLPTCRAKEGVQFRSSEHKEWEKGYIVYARGANQ